MIIYGSGNNIKHHVRDMSTKLHRYERHDSSAHFKINSGSLAFC